MPRRDAEPSRVVAHKYDSQHYDELLNPSLDALTPSSEQECVWIEVTGLADTTQVAALGRRFGLHELSLEDALDPTQRAKSEHYDNYTFVVFRSLALSEHVVAHHFSLFFGERFVITVRDVDTPSLAAVRERLKTGRGKIRDRAADYLAYALLDTLIDHCFPVLEAFDDELERIEDAVLDAEDADPIELNRHARRNLQTIRHAVWPARDVVTSLLKDDVPWIAQETRVHLRDCLDHVVQLQEMVESSREVAASLLEAYLSSVSIRTNEVMKVLTIIATIFIPLTFIAGVYGMNFNTRRSPLNMPELDWYWGYPSALLLMLSTALATLYYFRRKGWLGGRRGRK